MSGIKEFLSSPDVKDSVGTTARILRCFSPLYAASIGLDGKPQIRTAAFAFEREGALYFLTTKSSRFYAELSRVPHLQLCAFEAGTKTAFRLSGKACFTEEDEVIRRAAEERPDILYEAGGEKKMLIAFFLLGARAELEAESGDISLALPDPSGIFTGITIKKKTELRDRLSRILERREAEMPPSDGELTRLYDGALFLFAEAAKALWPRMDIRPIERAAVFETWDEREKYTSLAARLIGSAVIDKPEDFTYWLNPDTLRELREEKQAGMEAPAGL